jgi:hypothetical protein
MPTLVVGEKGRAGCFSLLVVLIAPEGEAPDHSTGERRSPPFTAAVVNEDEP